VGYWVYKEYYQIYQLFQYSIWWPKTGAFKSYMIYIDCRISETLRWNTNIMIIKSEKTNSFKSYIIIGLVVFGFGTWYSFGGLSMLFQYFKSSNWEKTPVSIIKTDLKTYKSEGKTLYSVECVYNYHWEGNLYTGTKVGFEKYRSADAFHKNRYRILHRQEKSGRSFSALVNPDNPQESILFRELQTTMLVFTIVGILFMMSGASLSIWGIHTWRKSYKINKLYPGKPWKAQKVSDDFIISDKALFHVFKAYGIGVGMGLFVSFFFIAFSDNKNTPIFPMLIIGIFALITIAIFVQAFYFTFRYFKYGSSSLVLSQIPLAPGMNFSGLIRIHRSMEPMEGLKIVFKCLKEYVEGHGKKSKHIKKTIFEDKALITESMGRCQGKIWAFNFMVPEGYPDHNLLGSVKYRWILEIKAETPGIDFGASFELPVHSVHSRFDIKQNPTMTLNGNRLNGDHY